VEGESRLRKFLSVNETSVFVGGFSASSRSIFPTENVSFGGESEEGRRKKRALLSPSKPPPAEEKSPANARAFHSHLPFPRKNALAMNESEVGRRKKRLFL